MKTKLILVEGIPGSGKTTFAQKIAEWYRECGMAVNLYLEGQAHPADLGWNACVPIAQYDAMLEKYVPIRDEILANTVNEGDYAVIAYTQVKTDDGGFYKELESFEVYDGRVPDETFFRLHYDRWRSFGEKAANDDALNIFECAFMQNHVNELLFWRNADANEVFTHHNRLLDSVKQLSPVLIYLSQPDIRETILRVAKERVSPEGDRWIDHVITYCESSPYGKRHSIMGFDGAMEFFITRKKLEMAIIDQLPIPHIIIENADYDWDSVWVEIETYLETLL